MIAKIEPLRLVALESKRVLVLALWQTSWNRDCERRALVPTFQTILARSLALKFKRGMKEETLPDQYLAGISHVLNLVSLRKRCVVTRF